MIAFVFFLVMFVFKLELIALSDYDEEHDNLAVLQASFIHNLKIAANLSQGNIHSGTAIS